MIAERFVRALLSRAGIKINGPAPWDISVRDSSFYRDLLRRGSLGLGESYMNGLWDCPRLDQFMSSLLSSWVSLAGALNPVAFGRTLRDLFVNVARRDPFRIGREHYDRGNDLYSSMLDSSMTYSCAYWDRGAEDLDAAQTAKLELVCRKLELAPGQKVLDIGCGWGSFARYAAGHYGVEVVGLTVSEQQARLAAERCRDLPVAIRRQDFRELSGERFDAVASIGMFEHVEPKNYGAYFDAARRALASGGRFLLHTISKPRWWNGSDPWIRKYIFPVGMIPAQRRMLSAARAFFPNVIDIHDFGGSNYDRTLMAWYRNFMQRWQEASPGPGDRRFRRMWEYYLLACAGAFRAGAMTVWQVLLSDAPVPTGYVPVR